LVVFGALAGCAGGDGDGEGDGATSPSRTASLASYDLCDAVGEEPAATFLGALDEDENDGGAVDEVQGRSTEAAAVCGWFLAPIGDATPEGVLVRVERLVADGNEVCRADPEDEVGELSVGGGPPDGGTGWVTTSDERVEAALQTDDWCAYLRGPAEVAPDPDVAIHASAALLGEVISGSRTPTEPISRCRPQSSTSTRRTDNARRRRLRSMSSTFTMTCSPGVTSWSGRYPGTSDSSVMCTSPSAPLLSIRANTP
jgi:hypothetical protein